MSAILVPFLAILAYGLIRFLVASFGAAPELTEGDAARQRRLRLAGAAILAAGLLSAGYVYATTAPAVDDPYAVLVGPTKNSDYQMEVVGGKANIYAADAMKWFISLWHGRRLAYTVATLSLCGGVACLYLAHPLLAKGSIPDESTKP